MTSLEETRKKLFDQLDKRVADGVLEQTNAELLKKHIGLAESSSEAEAVFALGAMYNRTGLYYDVKLEKTMTNKIHYFKKNDELSFACDPSKPTHKLIIGDNYVGLQNLLIQYKETIDVIYIDPPYGKDSLGQFADTNYDNALSRDNLLSMLKFRLDIAKQLLSDHGVIFCSIDDKNQAYVKCLFDTVFGEKNFVGCLIWQSATDNNPRQISTEHEYILCYCSNIALQDKWITKSENAEKIKAQYEKIKATTSNIDEIQKQLRVWIKANKENLKGVAHYNNVDEKGVYSSSSNSSNTKPGGYDFDIIHPVTQLPCAKPDFGWRWPEDTFKKYADAGEVEWGVDETSQPHIKKRVETATEQLKSVYYEDGRAATALLVSIMSEKKLFDNPKPVEYISRLLKFCSGRNAVVLDFFAGSGTAAHAVLELNRKDGGNRTCILCQLNEITDTTPNGIAYDVTAKRLKRIMTGECYDGFKDFPWIGNNEPYGENLDVFEIVSSRNDDVTVINDIDETLYGKQFDSLDKKIDWICSNFQNTQNILKERNDA